LKGDLEEEDEEKAQSRSVRVGVCVDEDHAKQSVVIFSVM